MIADWLLEKPLQIGCPQCQGLSFSFVSYIHGVFTYSCKKCETKITVAKKEQGYVYG